MDSSASPRPSLLQERPVAAQMSEQSQELETNSTSKNIIAYGATIGCLAGFTLVLTIGPARQESDYLLCGIGLGIGIGTTLGAAALVLSRYLRSLAGARANCYAGLLATFFGSDNDEGDSSRRPANPQV